MPSYSRLTSATPSTKRPPVPQASGAMSSIAGNFECELHRMSAREECYEKSKSAPPHPHKRKYSVELESVGGQFQLSSKQTSWERAKELVIPEDAISSHRPVTCEATEGCVRVSQPRPSLDGSSRGGPRTTSSPAPLRGAPPMSREQLNRQQRAALEYTQAFGTSCLLSVVLLMCSPIFPKPCTTWAARIAGLCNVREYFSTHVRYFLTTSGRSRALNQVSSIC